MWSAHLCSLIKLFVTFDLNVIKVIALSAQNYFLNESFIWASYETTWTNLATVDCYAFTGGLKVLNILSLVMKLLIYRAYRIEIQFHSWMRTGSPEKHCVGPQIVGSWTFKLQYYDVLFLFQGNAIKSLAYLSVEKPEKCNLTRVW